jgi:cytidylate kinase
MIITISGLPGSGKSTIAKTLAQKLGFKHYSAGDILRKMAEEKKVPLAKLCAKAEKDGGRIDHELDERTKQLGKNQDDFVLDSRMGFHFIPDSIKIFLDVDPQVACERIFNDVKAGKRKEEMKGVKNVEDVREIVAERVRSENSRYHKYYKVQYTDLSHYDMIVNVSHNSIEHIVDEIIRFVKATGKR